MANICKKPKLVLDSSEIEYLRDVSQSLIFPHREVIRAQVLLKYYKNTSITQIKKETLISRETIYKYVKKALSFGVREPLKDLHHSPKEPKITEESKQWVINLACTKPKDHGYASELWTYRTLSEHVKKHALQARYDCLNKA